MGQEEVQAPARVVRGAFPREGVSLPAPLLGQVVQPPLQEVGERGHVGQGDVLDGQDAGALMQGLEQGLELGVEEEGAGRVLLAQDHPRVA